MAQQRLVSWETGPIPGVLDRLLQDMTTGRNILFMTDGYRFDPSEEMTAEKVRKADIRTRTEKAADAQAARTKARAEVFTPAWLVNHMNNKCDEEWFGRPDVFNTEWERDGIHGWTGNGTSVQFGGLKWQDYILSQRLEITCGEAPFITTRYDAATGERFDDKKRVGILDRKMKIVAQSLRNEPDDVKVLWAMNALESCYGYEYQGDSLLLARCNVFITFMDYCRIRLKLDPSLLPLDEICDVICWNFWQMDGLENVVPGTGTRCMIKDWTTGQTVYFDDCMADGALAGTVVVQAPEQSCDEAVGGYFDDAVEPVLDGPESAVQDRIVASSVGLLVNSIPRSTLADDECAKGARLAERMAYQYYSTAQGFQMILDRMGSQEPVSTAAAGFSGLVDRFALKGRVTGAMKSSLRDFANEAYDPMMRLCRDSVELILRACVYHQQERADRMRDARGLAGIVVLVDWSGVPDGLAGKIAGFVGELDGYYHDGHDFRMTFDVADGVSEDEHGIDLGTVVRDTGRLLAICRKHVMGIGM